MLMRAVPMLLLLTACQAPLPPAAATGPHGLERVWIEAFGLE